MLTTDVIAQHLLSDARLSGIIDMQAAGVAESLCSLFNLLVETKGKAGNSEEEESDMDLDENEKAAERDHEEAQKQMENTGEKWEKPRMRRTRKAAPSTLKMDDAEDVKNGSGKSEATQADQLEPPAAKCLQLPKLPTNPEQYDLTKDDAKKAGEKEPTIDDAAKVKVPA